MQLSSWFQGIHNHLCLPVALHQFYSFHMWFSVYKVRLQSHDLLYNIRVGTIFSIDNILNLPNKYHTVFLLNVLWFLPIYNCLLCSFNLAVKHHWITKALIAMIMMLMFWLIMIIMMMVIMMMVMMMMLISINVPIGSLEGGWKLLDIVFNHLHWIVLICPLQSWWTNLEIYV